MILSIQIYLFCISGVCKAIMDTLQFHFDESIFRDLNSKFWNPEISWKNKYYPIESVEQANNSLKLKYIRKKWFNLIPIPVFLTDAWHLFQSIFLNSISISISLSINITDNVFIDFIIIRGIIGLSFWLFYDKILIKNKWIK